MATRPPATKTRPAAKKTAAAPSARPAKAKKVVAPAAKSAVKPAAKPATPAPTAPKEVKTKAKLVRDSFTMPQADFALIGALKERAIGFKRPAKKSELLRAGLQALAGLNDTALKAALDALAPLKPGRPKKGA
ncbi:MAG: hypothetical protein AB7U92_02705 [Piscinibacter sp.]|uniref:hypothetical protein n=1 Tax=Piscinibacter sp. TaxID=1903157 RepID=UPI003D0F4D4E